MKKAFVIISMILISVVAASAQTGAKGEANASRRSSQVEKRASASSHTGKRRAPGVLRLGPSTTYLKNGLKADEVVRLLGEPATVSERAQGEIRLATYTFERGAGRLLVAEFENGMLVSSRTEFANVLVRN
ncbi:MAG TPA: hypothetical protein VM095_14955 [Pyrinomonadaceae bacterium]|nr:hypothetical protein [Pyrinomonadaceae bacterium]